MMNEEKLSSSNENEQSAQNFKEYLNDFFTFRNVLNSLYHHSLIFIPNKITQQPSAVFFFLLIALYNSTP